MAQELLGTGKVRAIGVSNFSVSHLEAIRDCHVTPADNQIEVTPYLPNDRTIKYCQEHGIHVTAYAPLGARGTDRQVLNDPVVGRSDLQHAIRPLDVPPPGCRSEISPSRRTRPPPRLFWHGLCNADYRVCSL